MPNQKRTIRAPIFNSPPSKIDPELRRWLDNLTAKLGSFANDVTDVGADYDLICHVTRQVLSAGFTITPDSHDIEISSASAVVSDTTTAIKDGKNGQTIVLHNVGANSITIKNLANTSITEDLILLTDDTIVLRWSDTTTNWTLLSMGGLSGTTKGNIQNNSISSVGAAETDLISWTMPIDTLVDPSDIEIVTSIAFAANVNVKTVKFYLGGSNVVLNPITVAPNGIELHVVIRVWWRTTTTARINYTAIINTTGIFDVIGTATMNATTNWSTANVIKFTGTGVTNGDIAQRFCSMIVHRLP